MKKLRNIESQNCEIIQPSQLLYVVSMFVIRNLIWKKNNNFINEWAWFYTKQI